MDNQQLIEYLKMVLDVEQTIYTRNELIDRLNKNIIQFKPKIPEFLVQDKNKILFEWKGRSYFSIEEAEKQLIEYQEYYKNKIPKLKKELNSWKARKKEMDYKYNHTKKGFINGLFGSKSNNVINQQEYDSIKTKILELEEKIKEEEMNPGKLYNSFQSTFKPYKEKYNKENIAFSKKNNFYNEILKPYFDSQILELESSNKDSEKILKRLYNQGILYPTYRNIVAVSAIIEYLESGRCSSLEGEYGAYNKFDLDFKLDQIIQNQSDQTSLLRQLVNANHQIINQIYQLKKVVNESQERISHTLDSISSSIHQIIDNQNKIDSNITEGINKISNNQDRLNQSINSQTNILKQIKANSDITAYNQERSRKELEYLRRVDDLEKGRWWNY